MSGYLPARVIQGVGILMLVAAFVFWGATGRESVLLVTAAMTLILGGSYKNAIDVLTRKEIPPTPPSVKEEGGK